MSVKAYRRVLRGDPCAYCGGTAHLVDHIDPRPGGSNDWDNLTAACRSCNGRKGAMTMLAALAWVREQREAWDPARQALDDQRFMARLAWAQVGGNQ